MGHVRAASPPTHIHRDPTGPCAILSPPLYGRCSPTPTGTPPCPPLLTTPCLLLPRGRYALLVDPHAAAASLHFERTPPPSSGVGFNSSAPLLKIHARAVKLGEWRKALDAADEPPPSPMAKPAQAMVEEVELVPYGATELRMGALPWMLP
jgi:hypothetical protein